MDSFPTKNCDIWFVCMRNYFLIVCIAFVWNYSQRENYLKIFMTDWTKQYNLFFKRDHFIRPKRILSNQEEEEVEFWIK